MSILITGSEGVLGKVLKAKLRDRGHEVVGLDLHHGHDNVRADISNWRELDRVVGDVQPQYIYHLAGAFGRKNGQDFYEDLWRTNAIGQRNVIEACLKHDAHMIFASSSEAYGDAADMGSLHEDILKTHVPKFGNEYALSKWTGEKQMEIAIANDGLRGTILRFFNAYGGGEKYNSYRSVVCLFLYRLMHDEPITVYKNYHRVFLHVSDWANTVANVIEPQYPAGIYPSGNIFNIGGTEYLSVEELVEKIKKVIGGSNSVITVLPKELANVTNKKPDVSKAAELLGHNPVTTLDEGLLLTYQWMKKEYGLGDGRLRKVA